MLETILDRAGNSAVKKHPAIAANMAAVLDGTKQSWLFRPENFGLTSRVFTLIKKRYSDLFAFWQTGRGIFITKAGSKPRRRTEAVEADTKAKAV